MRPNRRMGHYLTPIIRDMQELEISPPNTMAASTSSDEFSEENEGHGALGRHVVGVNMLLSSLGDIAYLEGESNMTSTDMITPQSQYPHLRYSPAPPESNITEDPPNRVSSENQLNSISARAVSAMSNVPLPVLNSERCSPTKFRRIIHSRDMVAHSHTQPPLDKGRREVNKVFMSRWPRAMDAANRVIRYARCLRHKHKYQIQMSCLNCGLLPQHPVTGQCGHTRCSKCALKNTTCPCGSVFSEPFHVNIMIRDLIAKSQLENENSPSRVSTKPKENDAPDEPSPEVRSSLTGTKRRRRETKVVYPSGGNQRVPMSPRARYNHGLELLQQGRRLDAVPYLAVAAADGHPSMRLARPLLAEAISTFKTDPRVLIPHLNRSVRRLCSMSWIKPTDMECILCCSTFTDPVTTPCGHTFCRICLERTMDYRKRCPLCLRTLHNFMLSLTMNTVFVEAALRSINAVVIPEAPEPDLIPIFVCTVAYPSVPCPLYIFDPRYWLMIRRVLESGSRKFGMVTCDRGQEYTDYGTILEVRDCVHFEDGRSILSTIGLTRFKVIERGVRDGLEVARILPIQDVCPESEMEVLECRLLGNRIILRALFWLSSLDKDVLRDIETTFGTLPGNNVNDEWWSTTDGPAWLWWLVAVLPLRPEIKVLILSTNYLLKRMMAVDLTLEAVQHVAASTRRRVENSRQ
ncbi:LON peptidase N-terminal domain and RING finger protein 1 isoform X2 [Spodoptera frugiperda]|uniref:LON peptidase N-terminal domain and RING finger protein 1 isoform X2 n=1 Tax=Spodoptera frugiperda TaxID=7108 RepID=A0A9R0D128_SPOFR|nr:LON peptidase N-terminal domain and RING finger protein 1 isoform X2 [Spodoptera frugiperda]